MDIYYYCRKGNVPEVNYAINHGYDINSFNQMIYTPLHIACIYNRPRIVKLLLDNDADISIVDRSGRTPLMNAIRCKSILILSDSELVDRLLGSELHIDNNMNSELHYAVRLNNVTLLRRLCEVPHNSNYLNNRSISPLHIAASEGLLESFELLMNVIPTKLWNSEHPLLNSIASIHPSKSDIGITMIELVVQHCHISLGLDGYNAIHLAIINGLDTIAELLMDLYPNHLDMITKDGYGLLDLATRYNRSMITVLMDRGISFKSKLK